MSMFGVDYDPWSCSFIRIRTVILTNVIIIGTYKRLAVITSQTRGPCLNILLFPNDFQTSPKRSTNSGRMNFTFSSRSLFWSKWLLFFKSYVWMYVSTSLVCYHGFSPSTPCKTIVRSLSPSIFVPSWLLFLLVCSMPPLKETYLLRRGWLAHRQARRNRC